MINTYIKSPDQVKLTEFCSNFLNYISPVQNQTGEFCSCIRGSVSVQGVLPEGISVDPDETAGAWL